MRFNAVFSRHSFVTADYLNKDFNCQSLYHCTILEYYPKMTQIPEISNVMTYVLAIYGFDDARDRDTITAFQNKRS